METEFTQNQLEELAKANTETLRFYNETIKMGYVLIVLGLFLLVAAAFLFFTFNLNTKTPSTIFDFKFYAALAGPGLAAFGSGMFLISRSKKPFLVLTQTGMQLPVFQAEIPWQNISGYEMKDVDILVGYTRITLMIKDLSKMPTQKGYRTNIDFDGKSQKLLFSIYGLKNAEPALVAETLIAYWQSAQAREKLKA